MIVCFVDIDVIVDHQRLIFFIIIIICSCYKYMILLTLSDFIDLLVRFCFYNETAFSNSIIFSGKLSFIF